jgi:hypothetical protein
VIYDRASGMISYDPDGIGSQEQVAFAKVKAGLALTTADFMIV